MGEFALVVIAVALPSWRGQFAAGAVLCAASLLLWFVVPESGRWLQVQGRGAEAYEVRKPSPPVSIVGSVRPRFAEDGTSLHCAC